MESPAPQDTALLIMDVQEATSKTLQERPLFLPALLQVLQAARDRNIPVIFCVVGFRKGYPEASPYNKAFTALKQGGTYSLDTPEGARLHPALSVRSDDIVVTKKRHSAFSGSDLEVVLRAKGVRRLVLTGVSTSGVVLSTVREAADKDYGLIVLSDCCADMDPEVHRVLTTKIFPRQADVISSGEWITKLT